MKTSKVTREENQWGLEQGRHSLTSVTQSRSPRMVHAGYRAGFSTARANSVLAWS